MADKYDNIRKQYNTKGVNRGILTGTKRALSRASMSTRTFIRKELRKSVGVEAKRINNRVLVNKPEKGLLGRHSLKTSVAVATKRFMPMRYFKPKQRVVKTSMVGVKKKVKRYGVTVKIGRGRREIVPGAFIMDMPKGMIVAKRKGKAAYPTRELFTKVLQESVADRGSEFTKNLQQNFEKKVQAEIDFAVQRELNKYK